MTEKLQIGSVVLSKQGRDKGANFMVVSLEGNVVYVVDGDIRRLASPKKKNIKHVSDCGIVLDVIAEKIINGKKVFDSEVKSSLRQFAEKQG